MEKTYLFPLNLTIAEHLKMQTILFSAVIQWEKNLELYKKWGEMPNSEKFALDMIETCNIVLERLRSFDHANAIVVEDAA